MSVLEVVIGRRARRLESLEDGVWWRQLVRDRRHHPSRLVEGPDFLHRLRRERPWGVLANEGRLAGRSCDHGLAVKTAGGGKLCGLFHVEHLESGRATASRTIAADDDRAIAPPAVQLARRRPRRAAAGRADVMAGRPSVEYARVERQPVFAREASRAGGIDCVGEAARSSDDDPDHRVHHRRRAPSMFDVPRGTSRSSRQTARTPSTIIR